LLTRADGTPFRTPCTVPDVPARIHVLVFTHGERGELEAGEIDFATKRQVVARWSPDS
jgi:hypothetical protein